jgi:hypothetical protein
MGSLLEGTYDEAANAADFAASVAQWRSDECVSASAGRGSSQSGGDTSEFQPAHVRPENSDDVAYLTYLRSQLNKLRQTGETLAYGKQPSGLNYRSPASVHHPAPPGRFLPSENMSSRSNHSQYEAVGGSSEQVALARNTQVSRSGSQANPLWRPVEPGVVESDAGLKFVPSKSTEKASHRRRNVSVLWQNRSNVEVGRSEYSRLSGAAIRPALGSVQVYGEDILKTPSSSWEAQPGQRRVGRAVFSASGNTLTPSPHFVDNGGGFLHPKQSTLWEPTRPHTATPRVGGLSTRSKTPTQQYSKSLHPGSRPPARYHSSGVDADRRIPREELFMWW